MIARLPLNIKAPKPFQHREHTFPKLKQITVNGVRHYEVPTELSGSLEPLLLPSITTILAANKEKKKALAAWKKRIGEDAAKKISNHATSRGTSLHRLCENYLTNSEVEIKTLFEKENFNKIRGILEEHIYEVHCIEQKMYSLEYGIAGSTDLICEWALPSAGEVLPTVVDFKTSGKAKAKYKQRIREYFIQGAAYALMFEEMTGIHVPQIAIVIVVEEELYPELVMAETKDWIHPLEEAIASYKESIHVQQEENIN